MADIPLVSPADGARATLPAQLCWTRRSATSDNYALGIGDPVTQKVATTDYLGYVSCVSVTGLPAGWPSGRAHRWWVLAYQGDDPDSTPYNYGSSYGDRGVTITFSAAGASAEPGIWREVGQGCHWNTTGGPS